MADLDNKKSNFGYDNLVGYGTNLKNKIKSSKSDTKTPNSKIKVETFESNDETEKNKTIRERLTKESSNVEEEYRKFLFLAEEVDSSNKLVNKKGTTSYSNDYAFISYGGSKLGGGSVKNDMWGSDGSHTPTKGLFADYEKWKEPTAKNIIEWSQSYIPKKPSRIMGLSGEEDKSTNDVSGGQNATSTSGAKVLGEIGKQKVNNINEQLEQSVDGVGNFRYEWKDFSFLKNYGKIPNNRLITLRRYKFPVMDNGVIASKGRFMSALEQNDSYVSSDSARALTYFGEGTGNELENNILPFTVNLQWQSLSASGTDGISEYSGSVNSGYAKGPMELEASQVLGNFTSSLGNNTLKNLKKSSSESSIASNIVNYFGLLQYNQKQKELGNDNFIDQFSRAVATSPDFDPYKNEWKNRVYGPINVISKTYQRKRGLEYRNDIKINFSFDTMQIDSLNPKIAMLDILSNMLALTYNNGSFWGGEYRFFTNIANVPIDTALSDIMQDLGAGRTNTQNLDNAISGIKATIDRASDTYKNQGTELKDTLTNMFKPFFAKNADLQKNIGGLETALSDYFTNTSATSVVTEEQKNAKLGDMFKVLQNSIVNDSKLLDSIKDTLNTNTSDSNRMKSALGMLIFGQGSNINNIKDSVLSIQPLVTGEPVGEWHLVVGNPMNPIAMIGNLICVSADFKFGKALGADDFPTELEVSITLKHGRDRDKGDIESIFNLGQGRLYVSGQRNGKYTREPWNTGASTRNTENDTAEPLTAAIDRIKKEAIETKAGVTLNTAPVQPLVSKNLGNELLDGVVELKSKF